MLCTLLGLAVPVAFIVLLFLTRSRVGKIEQQNERLWAELSRAKDRLRVLEGPDHVPEPEFVPPPRAPTTGAFVEPPEAPAPAKPEAPAATPTATPPAPTPTGAGTGAGTGTGTGTADVPPPVRAERGVAVAATAGAVPAARTARPAPTPKGSFESFVGGRVLLVVGVVVVLFGLGFLLKVAIDRGLIGPAARLGIGTVAGIGALVGGHVLRKRGFDVFGQVLMGGGLGALFLCVRFATINYGFIHQYTGFALTAAITLLGVVLALRLRARMLAYVGFFGGFLAPALLSTGSDQLERLAAWLIVLDLGVLIVLTRRRWHGLDLMALLASVGYFVAWHEGHFTAARFDAAVTALGALTGAALLVGLLPALLSKRPVISTSLATALLAGVSGTWAAHDLLFPDHRVALGGAIAGLAVVYLVAGYLRSVRETDAGTDAVSLYAFGLAAVATAVPVLMKGHAVAPALAFAGLAAIVVAARRGLWVFLAGGLVMILVGIVDLLGYRLPPHDAPFVPFANGEFYAFAAPCAALVLGGLVLLWQTNRKGAAGVLIAAGVWLYAPLLSAEVWWHFDLGKATYGAAAANDYGLAAAAAIAALFGTAVAWTVRGRELPALLFAAGPLAVAGLLSFVMLVAGHNEPFLPFLNVFFLGGLIVGAAPVAVAWLSGNGTAKKLLPFLALALVFVFMTRDIQEWGDYAPEETYTRSELRFRANVWISIAWAAYGAALIVSGFVRDRAGLRWAGLIVFGLTLLKIFVVDMSELDTVYRIGSFLVLGVLLVAASFLYQRARAKEEPPGEA